MPRAEAGTAKAIGNAIKAKGLGRLRWYCQVCQKQCRDDNGFKMHTQSESHLRQMLVVGEHAGKHISDFSKDFQDEFITLLSRRHGTSRVRANAVYNEYIQDKHHIHMNSTRWVTLTEFIKYLGREGIVRVDENEKGFWIAWVDTSPKALAKQAESQKKERMDMDEEQRQRKQLQEQIERAKLQEEARRAQGGDQAEKGLQRNEGEKISLSLAVGKAKVDESTDGPASLQEQPNGVSSGDTGTIQLGSTTSKPSNPLKRAAPGNVFKTAKVAKTSSTGTAGGERSSKSSDIEKGNIAGKKFLTAAERLMLEDQERLAKQAQKRGGGYQGVGPSRR